MHGTQLTLSQLLAYWTLYVWIYGNKIYIYGMHYIDFVLSSYSSEYIILPPDSSSHTDWFRLWPHAVELYETLHISGMTELLCIIFLYTLLQAGIMR